MDEAARTKSLIHELGHVVLHNPATLAGTTPHFVIPMILDAPGAVITTSTRPDNLAATLPARSRAGPVAVFDPQRLAPWQEEQHQRGGDYVEGLGRQIGVFCVADHDFDR